MSTTFTSWGRELAKAVQSELAGANAVAEEALSCMATVRSHAAEGSARAAYAGRLRAFYTLQVRPSASRRRKAILSLSPW